MINAIRDHVAIMSDRDLLRSYELLTVFPRSAASFEPNPAQYPKAWRQEYFIFRRKVV